MMYKFNENTSNNTQKHQITLSYIVQQNKEKKIL